MAQVTITINHRNYPVTCDDGQEEHLQKLAGHIDRRVTDLVASVGQVGEARLLVMASLLLADDLYESHDQLDTIKRRLGGNHDEAGEAEIVETLESCARRIEALAARLEGT